MKRERHKNKSYWLLGLAFQSQVRILSGISLRGFDWMLPFELGLGLAIWV